MQFVHAQIRLVALLGHELAARLNVRLFQHDGDVLDLSKMARRRVGTTETQ